MWKNVFHFPFSPRLHFLSVDKHSHVRFHDIWKENFPLVYNSFPHIGTNPFFTLSRKNFFRRKQFRDKIVKNWILREFQGNFWSFELSLSSTFWRSQAAIKFSKENLILTFQHEFFRFWEFSHNSSSIFDRCDFVGAINSGMNFEPPRL